MDRMGIIDGLAGLLETLIDVAAHTSAESAQREQQAAVDSRVIGPSMAGFGEAVRPRRKAKKPCGACGDKAKGASA